MKRLGKYLASRAKKAAVKAQFIWPIMSRITMILALASQVLNLVDHWPT
ncbi:hypothetical protein [Arthrobacter sp. GMC3]|nr:hypothetical protein [Arthrobacter sp. GMC3]